VPCLIAGLDVYRLALNAAIVNAVSGEIITPRVVIEGQTVALNLVIQTLTISFEKLASGSYLLYIYAEEAESGSLSYAATPLTIR
jgi:hypothetical protein